MAEKRTAPFWVVAYRGVVIWDKLSVPSPRLKDPSLSQIITTRCIIAQKGADHIYFVAELEITQPGCCRT
jgi:hypothetical protein